MFVEYQIQRVHLILNHSFFFYQLRVMMFIVIVQFMQGRKKGRKRVIKLIKNQQQSAQDKLLEISCQSEDKYINQSQMLPIEHQNEYQSIQKVDLGKNLIGIINKLKRTHNKIKTEGMRYKKVDSLIANRFQSQQVFVGVKSTIENKFKESNIVSLDKERTKSTSIFNKYISRSIPFRKSSNQISQKLHYNTLVLKKSDIHIKSLVYFAKRRDINRHSQTLQNLRARTNPELFFNQEDKNRTITKQVTRFI